MGTAMNYQAEGRFGNLGEGDTLKVWHIGVHIYSQDMPYLPFTFFSWPHTRLYIPASLAGRWGHVSEFRFVVSLPWLPARCGRSSRGF
jgi:hypothetical protein